MEYILEVQYQDGVTFKVIAKGGLELVMDIGARVYDNEKNKNISSWTIRPVPGTEKS